MRIKATDWVTEKIFQWNWHCPPPTEANWRHNGFFVEILSPWNFLRSLAFPPSENYYLWNVEVFVRSLWRSDCQPLALGPIVNFQSYASFYQWWCCQNLYWNPDIVPIFVNPPSLLLKHMVLSNSLPSFLDLERLLDVVLPLFLWIQMKAPSLQ